MRIETEMEEIITTYRKHYQPLPSGKYAHRAQKIKQSDPSLISGQVHNNLKINGRQQKSQVWPNASIGAEEYRAFLKRLECCKKEIFKLYFRCPSVNTDWIEEMLRNLEKTTYQYSYSPDIFVSRKESRRLQLTDDPTNMKYYPTTYGTYYNRLQEVERFKDILYAKLCKEDKEELKSELRKYHKLGVTTYYVGYCIPAIEKSKSKILKDAPLDRYTLRRI